MVKEIIDFRKSSNIPEKITLMSIAEKTVKDDIYPDILVASISDLIQAREDLISAVQQYEEEGWVFSGPYYQQNDAYIIKGYKLDNSFIG